MTNIDTQVRSATFEWLAAQTAVHGPVLPRHLLGAGFEFQGTRIPLVGPQGIFKPRVLPELPLSITTSPQSRYHDHFAASGLLRYAYRGTDPLHHENVGLRRAMERRVPLVYFHGVVTNRYLAEWPVFIVGDDPGQLSFTVALDDLEFVRSAVTFRTGATEDGPDLIAEGAEDARRHYVTATFRRRLHQQAFRERVLLAYREQCALCRLRHAELLNAAHITGDAELDGEPIVSNGLALCKLHHAAFDRHFLAVRPDYVIEVRRQILEEEDGPMLLHGLKEMHGRELFVPRNPRLRPDPDRLARRLELFRAAV